MTLIQVLQISLSLPLVSLLVLEQNLEKNKLNTSKFSFHFQTYMYSSKEQILLTDPYRQRFDK